MYIQWVTQTKKPYSLVHIFAKIHSQAHSAENFIIAVVEDHTTLQTCPCELLVFNRTPGSIRQ